ncbi:unnamed protein product [Rhizophagus irregularis]|uniref:Uncharacterized protein n=1 Tax=Rhizophagus irregularis TaxID=588596 RepID=A0A2I1HAQ5_9GLOM|nr:hypothetical protein RhiirA4_475867 [Rhizophagus irregularis]CAB4408885.1 unnamed protein product [Rhizophagus irregularis]
MNTNQTSVIGKILKKTSCTSFLFQHWITIDGSDLIVKCMGCDTFGRPRDISTETCIKRGQHCKATVLKVEVLTKKIDGASYRIVTPIDLFRRRTLTLPSVFPDEQRLVTVDILALDHSLIAKLRN